MATAKPKPKPTPAPTPAKDLLPDGTDLDKLAKAVAKHETGSCTLGNSALQHNNAFGIRQWDKWGNPSFKTFKTCAESHEAFKTLWRKHYGRFPDWQLAKKYSGNDRPDGWLANVKKFYYSQ